MSLGESNTHEEETSLEWLIRCWRQRLIPYNSTTFRKKNILKLSLRQSCGRM